MEWISLARRGEDQRLEERKGKDGAKMRTITFVVDTVDIGGHHGMMFSAERDEQKGPPTLKSIQEGIILQRIEDAVKVYLSLLVEEAEQEAD